MKEDINGQDPYEVRLSYFEFSFFAHVGRGTIKIEAVVCCMHLLVKAKKKMV